MKITCFLFPLHQDLEIKVSKKQNQVRIRKTSSVFGDLRLDNRYELLTDCIAAKQHVVVNKLAEEHSGKAGFYRFLNNAAVTEQALLSSIRQRCSHTLEAGKPVLVMHDTTIFDYSSARSDRRQSPLLGPIGNHYGWGYMAHVSMAVGADDASIRGIAGLKLWSRSHTATANAHYHTPLEEKESYRWVQACRQSAETLSDAGQILHIMDREADIYDCFVKVPQGKQHLLIRSRTDRRIVTQEGYETKLSTYLASLSCSGSYIFTVKGECGKRKKREAVMEVRYGKVALLNNNNVAYQKHYPKQQWVWVVEARERAASVPAGEQAIVWRLLTTLAVEQWVCAVEKIYYYSLRWLIEELFRLLKKEGFNIEASELVRAEKLRKIAIIAMDAATKVLMLKQAREGESRQPIEAVFTAEQEQCLKQLVPKLEGSTQLQKNPHDKGSLAWAAWTIARLGGWSGYASQRKPGVITLTNGLKAFEQLFLGWKLARQTYV